MANRGASRDNLWVKYLSGTTTRRVSGFLAAVELSQISASTVSRWVRSRQDNGSLELFVWRISASKRNRFSQQ